MNSRRWARISDTTEEATTAAVFTCARLAFMFLASMNSQIRQGRFGSQNNLDDHSTTAAHRRHLGKAETCRNHHQRFLWFFGSVKIKQNWLCVVHILRNLSKSEKYRRENLTNFWQFVNIVKCQHWISMRNEIQENHNIICKQWYYLMSFFLVWQPQPNEAVAFLQPEQLGQLQLY
jgi:hypothetical protein